MQENHRIVGGFEVEETQGCEESRADKTLFTSTDCQAGSSLCVLRYMPAHTGHIQADTRTHKHQCTGFLELGAQAYRQDTHMQAPESISEVL